MDIKSILQSTIAQIKASEEREVQTVKDRVMREKIIPYNQELDQARQKAEQELLQQHNARVQASQEQFAKEKELLLQAGEKKKTNFANATLATETYEITSKAEKAISKLTAQIEEING